MSLLPGARVSGKYRACTLHHHHRLGAHRQELGERGPLQASSRRRVPRLIRNHDLENSLSQIYGDERIVLHDGLLHMPWKQQLWHLMPTEL